MNISISIAKPCHQNWNVMSVKTDGRYCDSCQKVVKDFTQMSDDELIAYMSHKKENECGRFREDQVTTSFSDKNSFYYNFRIKAVAFFAVMAARLLNPFDAKAQDSANVKKYDADRKNNFAEKKLFGDSVIYHVTGTVKSRTTGRTLSYTTVLVEVNGKPVGGSTYTDHDGNFELNIPAANSSDKIDITFSRSRHKTIYVRNYEPSAQALHVSMHKTFKARFRRQRAVMGAYF